LGDTLGTANSLNNLGRVAYDQGDYARAAALHEESLALRRELGEKRGIAYSLVNLGDVALAQGHHGQASVMLKEGLTLFHEVGDKRGITISLEDLAHAATGPDGTPEARQRAGRLLGAAAALLATSVGPLLAHERADHERTVAALRAGLGDVAFEAAWADGQAMTLERALALALDASPPA
jgi:hypothetical protein